MQSLINLILLFFAYAFLGWCIEVTLKEEIRVETERLRQEAEERVAQMRLEVAENLEPTRSVKNEIIEKQDALIGLLYREEDASPEIRELKREVESKKAVLQKRRALFPKL